MDADLFDFLFCFVRFGFLCSGHCIYVSVLLGCIHLFECRLDSDDVCLDAEESRYTAEVNHVGWGRWEGLMHVVSFFMFSFMLGKSVKDVFNSKQQMRLHLSTVCWLSSKPAEGRRGRTLSPHQVPSPGGEETT